MKKLPQIVKRIKDFTNIEVNKENQKTISYTQFSTFKQCPLKWSLQYKDGKYQYENSINTIFGTAMHSVIQNYLTVLYNQSGKKADEIDLENELGKAMKEGYKTAYEQQNKTHFSTPEEINEFYEEGVEILNYLKENRRRYFSTKGWYLVGIEIPLMIHPDETRNDILFKGFLDLVLYHEPTETFYIKDFKTSRSSWTDNQKRDEQKQFQLVLYKYFFHKQFDVPIDNIEVEFMVLKRKVWGDDYASRIQEVVPASGKIKTKRALTQLHEFIQECFQLDGGYKDITHLPIKNNNCKYCAFYKTELCTK